MTSEEQIKECRNLDFLRLENESVQTGAPLISCRPKPYCNSTRDIELLLPGSTTSPNYNVCARKFAVTLREEHSEYQTHRYFYLGSLVLGNDVFTAHFLQQDQYQQRHLAPQPCAESLIPSKIL